MLTKDKERVDKYNRRKYWICQCSCEKKTIKSVRGADLINGRSKSCGCWVKEQNIIEKKKKFIGKQFGRWKVIDFDETTINDHISKWICECQCEKKTIKSIHQNSLVHGKSTSCGCINKEIVSKVNKKYNTYNLAGEFGIGYLSNGDEFYFDLEDYDLIKDYSWCDCGGYIYTEIRGERNGLFMHRLIMNVTDRETQVDHIYHNKHDNRKSQMRLVTSQQNTFNRKVKGVYKKKNRWIANLSTNGIQYRKSFKTYEEALNQRKLWEEEHYGEYAYKEEPQYN